MPGMTRRFYGGGKVTFSNYSNFLIGVNHERLYFSSSTMSGAIIGSTSSGARFLLMPNDVGGFNLSGQKGVNTHQVFVSGAFEVTFPAARIIQGNLGGSLQIDATPRTGARRAQLRVYAYHVDSAGTATLMGSSIHRIRSVDTSPPLPTTETYLMNIAETLFNKNDKLRITLEAWGRDTTAAQTKIHITLSGASVYVPFIVPE